MALTFGTLLSSQGADAHRHDPFGPLPGQPTKLYSVGFARSNRHRPLPLGLAGADNRVARTWGDVRPGPPARFRAPNVLNPSTPDPTAPNRGPAGPIRRPEG
jgi:hypothetical protein